MRKNMEDFLLKQEPLDCFDEEFRGNIDRRCDYIRNESYGACDKSMGVNNKISEKEFFMALKRLKSKFYKSCLTKISNKTRRF